MYSIPTWNLLDSDELNERFPKLPARKQLQIKHLRKKVRLYPEHFGRTGQEYEERALLSILSDAVISDRLLKCIPSSDQSCVGVYRSQCGLRKLCDYCAYRVYQRAARRLTTTFASRRVYALHISPRDRYELTPEMVPIIRDEMTEQFDILSHLRKDCVFSKAVGFAEIAVSLKNILYGSPHLHSLIWDADEVQIQKAKDLLAPHYSVDFDGPINRRHFDNLLRYVYKALPIANTYREAEMRVGWNRDATIEDIAAEIAAGKCTSDTPEQRAAQHRKIQLEMRDLNEDVANALDGVYHCFDEYVSVRYFGEFNSKRSRHLYKSNGPSRE